MGGFSDCFVSLCYEVISETRNVVHRNMISALSIFCYESQFWAQGGFTYHLNQESRGGNKALDSWIMRWFKNQGPWFLNQRVWFLNQPVVLASDSWIIVIFHHDSWIILDDSWIMSDDSWIIPLFSWIKPRVSWFKILFPFFHDDSRIRSFCFRLLILESMRTWFKKQGLIQELSGWIVTGISF